MTEFSSLREKSFLYEFNSIWMSFMIQGKTQEVTEQKQDPKTVDTVRLVPKYFDLKLNLLS